MSWRSSVASLATAATVLLGVPGPASATPPSKERVRMMLSGFEDVPPAARWRDLGPETLPVLIELYRDRSQPPFVRLRSVHAASHFPTPATRTFLLAVARAPGQSDLFVREAVLALGRAFGERALSDVRPFLESPEPVVREGAVLAIGRMGTPAAVEVLRRRLVTESAEHVRDSIQRQIRRAPR